VKGSKWNARAVALVAAMDAVDVIVTDRKPSTEERTLLENLSVEVVIV
jgi:DeoR/GlpR family transcriptional regulator of sugar metabolism